MTATGANHRRFHSTSAIRPNRVNRSSTINGNINENDELRSAIYENVIDYERRRSRGNSLAHGSVNGHGNGFHTEGPNGQSNGLNGNGISKPAKSSPKPIAICGMALRLPGGLTTPQQFWEFLLAKGDARCRVPESRYNVSTYHSTSGKPGTVKTEYGYFLDESTDLGALDASFFSMTRAELERTDPHHRQMLEVARECLENAGEVNWRGQSIGCYMGSFGEDWCEMFAKENQQHGLWRVTGFGDFMLSNRVSYEMDLKGPSMTIRTGCSAALIALHEACQAVERGDCSSAIIGGANLILAPGMTTAMTEQGVLSADGSCKTFSADANGYARGEAINAIFIKPLDDALRDGNPIRAVIRATATNSDGKTPGISCPSTEAHEAMIRRAYEVADLDFSETAFVECHGTGTPIGDPLEANAVGRVFGDSGVYIGSVKPNVGHSEGASGLTSLIKTVLALENRIIPPNIKFSKPNPKIEFGTNRLKVPMKPTAWPKDRRERASINSFGIGGSNAHAILDSAASFGAGQHLSPLSETAQLLLHSANTQESLKKMVASHQQFVQRHPGNLSDLAYTLGNRREHLSHRAFSIVGGESAPTTSSFARAGPSPEIAMVFTGQGAQWPEMGREMIESNVVFRKSIRSMDKILQGLPHPPTWRIEGELLKPPKMSQLHSAELSQPLCTALQIALVDTLSSIGIEASSVVGHSSGEIGAAYAAGALTMREAIIVASARGVITKYQKRSGGMAAIGMGWDDTSKYLVPGVVIACENSPSSVTISGDKLKVEEVVAAIQRSQPDIMARALKVDKAYHSYHMEEVGDEYHQSIEDRVIGMKPNKLFFSSVSGKLLRPEENLGARYWQRNLESPVLFRTAVASLIRHQQGKNILFLEVGPHSALAGPLRQTLAQAGISAPYVPAMLRNKDSLGSVLSAVGQLYLNNVQIDFKTLMPCGSVLTDIPLYPWNHENSYWYESRQSKEWRFRKFPHHDLLGVRTAESTDLEPSFRNLLHMDNAPWIRDHKIKDDIIFPCAGYVAMIGEAVRQLSGIDEGYSLRHVVVSTALVLNENKPTEIITSLKRHRLTDSLDSQWWEFSIASHNGANWTKHCTGQARAQADTILVSDEVITLPRKVETAKWYETMRHIGLNYGPQFQGLTNITANVTQQTGAAETINTVRDEKTNYHLHPTTIDFFLQLMSVAVAKGISRSFRKMAVPTDIEELSIYRCPTNVYMHVSATSSPKGAITGGGECVADGKLVLRSTGIKLSPLEEEEALDAEDMHAAARLQWRPDIDFLEASELIKPSVDRESYAPLLDELTRLCVRETSRRLADLKTNLPHMAKFQSWLKTQVQAPGHSRSYSVTDSARRFKVHDLVHQLSATPAAPAATAMHEVLNNITEIHAGTTEPLEVLLSNGTLTKLYNFMDECDRSGFIELLAHSKPNLRVLEIGAGTGGTTNAFLKHLTTSDGRPMYSNYTFTDISAGFFVAAKERFKASPNMQFATLDISKDPIEQGFQEGSYDLVLATNVLHATKNLGETLTNVRKLLHANGRLLMQELCTRSKWTNYIMGVLPGWWLGDADGRPDEPYVSPERWEAELVRAGFEGLDATVLDAKEPFQLNAIMVAKPKTLVASNNAVTLLCGKNTGLATGIRAGLMEVGYDVSICTLEDSPPPDQDVMAILDLDEPFFENIESTRFEAFKKFLAQLGDSGVFWLTRPSQITCHDPRFAQTIGAARALRSELSIDFATCETDKNDLSLEKIVPVFDKFQRRQHDEILEPDLEYAIIDGTVHIGRYHPCSVNSELTDTGSSDVMALDIGKYGRLSTLHWSQRLLSTLVDDEVEIETRAVGLNFRDVLIAMGIVDGSKDSLGLEAAGIIRRIGPEVKDLEIGDRVIVLGTGCFSTLVTTSEQLCTKIPDDLTFEEGATMPCVYGTVVYSLTDVGRLEKGQSILIHSACGGVGIAAIQVAGMLGAEIYTTVGNEEKVQYLMSTFGLPRNRIFNSRDASFLPDLMRETRGNGVDLVLNSLSGELLHTSWKCVAEFGKMIEIGKRDLIGAAKLDMGLFLANRSYCCVDLGEICIKKPRICNRLLKRTMEYFQEGHIQPIRPTKTFSAASIEDSFRYMQKGTHIGKIVVSMDNSITGDTSNVMGPKKTLRLNPCASYLLVGGLGGLGRTVSNWMVEHGARNLIYLSRSAGNGADDQTFFEELRSQDCKVQIVQGSVSNPEDVQRAVSGAHKPLKGILQMSMVLRDESFPRMTHEQWTTTVTPKVTGTWNLHTATSTAGIDLDFFVLFSSISGVIGQVGQVNYAAANTFLDAFVQYRRSLRLPASAIDIGMVEDTGYVAQNAALLGRLKAAGAHGLREQEVLDALHLAITPASKDTTRASKPSFTSNEQFVLGLRSHIPLSDPANRAIWRKDRRMAAYHNSAATNDTSTSSASNDVLKSFIATATGDLSCLRTPETATFLATEIGKKLFDFLLKPEEELDISRSLAEVGMDSLVAIEMRGWWRRAFGFDISVLEMLGMGSIEALGKCAAEGLCERLGSGEGMVNE